MRPMGVWRFVTSGIDAIHAAWTALPTWLWPVLYGVWIVGSVLFILQQRRPPVTTLAWIIAFIFLPLVGALVYFAFGPRRLKRKRIRRLLAKVMAARMSPNTSAPFPQRLGEREWLAALARVPCSSGDPPPSASQSLRLFAGGDETYDAIVQVVAQARTQVHLEYYIFEPDAVGIRLRDALIERARAGVAVRCLVDALGSSHAKPSFWAPLLAAGGEVRRFNPPRLFKPRAGRMNFRSHRKIVVVDGLHAFTGGINVSAGNSALSSGGSAWRDTHLEIRGAPAQDLQVVFLEDWLFAGDETAGNVVGERAREAFRAEAQLWFPPAPAGQGPWVQIVDSGPDQEHADIHRYYFSAIAGACHRVWITTPYFVPDESLLTALVTAKARGVDVRLIVPQRGDSWLVTAAASTFVDDLTQQGVPVYEFQQRMIHAKTMVVDDELAVVGTANLDNRSFRLNFEVIAAVYDTDMTQQLAALFELDLQQSKPVDPERGKGRHLQQVLASAARLLAPVL